MPNDKPVTTVIWLVMAFDYKKDKTEIKGAFATEELAREAARRWINDDEYLSLKSLELQNG